MTFETINQLKDELQILQARKETIEQLLCLYSPLPTTPQAHPACGADPDSKAPLRGAYTKNGRHAAAPPS